MLTLPDGHLLFATGDNLPTGTNGRRAAQDEGEHVSKLLIIDPDADRDARVTVAAKGLRNTQALQFTDASQTAVAFADIGGGIAEEINVVEVADLLDTTTVENFGWGEASDGRAREGTFYIDAGAAWRFRTGRSGGRAAVRGGVRATLCPGRARRGAFRRQHRAGDFGDLLRHTRFGVQRSVTGPALRNHSAAERDQCAGLRCAPIDIDGDLTTLRELGARNPNVLGRAEPRFFKFADGTAGVLLERNGGVFSLTQVANVPLPASSMLLGAGVLVLAASRRRAVRAR